MTILVIGILSNTQQSWLCLKASRCSGFTLLEVMVVVVIVGVLLTFITLSIGDGKVELLERDAKRLVSLLKLAGEEAVLNNQEYALVVTEEGYEFQVFDTTDIKKPKWLSISNEDDHLFRARTFEEGIELKLSLEDKVFSLATQKKDEPSRIYLSSSGEITPFELTFKDDISRVSFYITGKPDGQFEVEGPIKEQ